MKPPIVYLVTVPVYNEAPVLEKSIRELSAFLSSFWPDKDAFWAILIADNGSYDGTGDIARKIARENQRVVYSYVSTKGRGAALREAVAVHPASYYIFIDVDLPIELRDIKKIIAPLEGASADLVFGKRIGARAWYRRVMTRGWSFFMKAFFGIVLSDAQCGIFAVNARAAEIIASCHEDGWFLNSELIIRCVEKGMRITEIPISWIESRFPARRSKVSNPPREILKGAGFFGRMLLRSEAGSSGHAKKLIAGGSLLAVLLVANTIAVYGKGYGMLSGILPRGLFAVIIALALYFLLLPKIATYGNGARWRTAMTIVIGFFVLYFLVTLPMAPDRSQDIYWNLLLTRGFSLFHLNPYTTTPAMLPSDAWSAPVSAWTTLVMTQGPLWVLSLFLPSFFGNPLAAIVALRTFFFAVVCFSLVAFWKILGQLDVSPERRPQFFILLLWNPFLFQEIFIDLHADVFVLASIVLAFYFFLKNKGEASILALVIGGFFKYVPWLLIPIPLFWDSKGILLPLRAMARRVLVAGGLLLAGFAIYYLPFGGPIAGLQGFFHQTLDVISFQEALIGTDLLRIISNNELILRVVGIAIFYLALLAFVKKKKMPEGFSVPFLLLFFFGTSWFMPWYVLWVLPLLALVFSPWVFAATCGILLLTPDVLTPLAASEVGIYIGLVVFCYRNLPFKKRGIKSDSASDRFV